MGVKKRKKRSRARVAGVGAARSVRTRTPQPRTQLDAYTSLRNLGYRRRELDSDAGYKNLTYSTALRTTLVMSIVALVILGVVLAGRVYRSTEHNNRMLGDAIEAARTERAQILSAVQAAQATSLGNRSMLVEIREEVSRIPKWRK